MEFRLNADFIELDNLLKVLEMASGGPHAKTLILSNQVKVNGLIEQRVRRKLRSGDKVEYDGKLVTIIKKEGKMRKIIFAVLLFVCAGCGFVFQDFDAGPGLGLTYGMSKEEVSQKLGQPSKMDKVSINGKEYELWEYAQSRQANVNSLGMDRLKIFFSEGKLVQRNKDKVYGQPDYQYLESLDPQAGVKPEAKDKAQQDQPAAADLAPAQPQENLK